MPEWLVEELIKEYSIGEVEDICIASNEKPKTTIRINKLKASRDEILKELEENKIEYEETELLEFIHIKNVKNIGELELFKKGFFTIQDIGAGKIGLMLSPKENETVLDACSAPGGKTTHLAEIMGNKGTIVACDIHEHRIKLVEDNANRLGIDIIETKLMDASVLQEEYIEKFDKILLDVPCMGIGVMKRKPDIKWQREKEDIEELTELQYKILDNCAKYLKTGGELVYSTCSILKSENENVVEKWLKSNSIYTLEETKRINPTKESDGFFMAKISKIEEIKQ